MSSSPLAGRRVIEVGTMLAAPFATHILSQLGAEVIKVEPAAGDPTRSLVRGGPSGTFIAYSHGKKSVGIDLDSDEGHAVFSRLLATADVLVHNLAPRSARRLRLSQADCEAVNPKLIYCHIRGYGPGPQGDDLASNPVAEASTGVMEGNRVDGRPGRLGPSYHDQFAGAYAVIGILAALVGKSERAEDRHVEIGLYETGLHVAARDLVGVQLKTQLLGKPEREPHGEFSMPGYGAYQTADDRWVYLLMLNDGHWDKFCRALGLPQAGDPALAQLRQRKKAREAVEAIVWQAVRACAFDDVVARLTAGGVGCTEVLPIERVLDAPQAHQPGTLRDVKFRGLEFAVPEFPRAGESTVETLPPPQLGEHTLEILKSLGIDAVQAAALVGSGAVVAPSEGAFAWAPVRHG